MEEEDILENIHIDIHTLLYKLKKLKIGETFTIFYYFKSNQRNRLVKPRTILIRRHDNEKWDCAVSEIGVSEAKLLDLINPMRLDTSAKNLIYYKPLYVLLSYIDRLTGLDRSEEDFKIFLETGKFNYGRYVSTTEFFVNSSFSRSKIIKRYIDDMKRLKEEIDNEFNKIEKLNPELLI